jgi:hypothetical protein
MSESGSLGLEFAPSPLNVDRTGGSKVIGDRFENLFSIYRRDFLKVIGDHFGVARQLLSPTGWPINLGTEINLGHLPGASQFLGTI